MVLPEGNFRTAKYQHTHGQSFIVQLQFFVTFLSLKCQKGLKMAILGIKMANFPKIFSSDRSLESSILTYNLIPSFLSNVKKAKKWQSWAYKWPFWFWKSPWIFPKIFSSERQKLSGIIHFITGSPRKNFLLGFGVLYCMLDISGPFTPTEMFFYGT